MKQCFKCNETKPLSEFYKHSQMADGHLNKCKDCTKKDVRKNYRENIDHYKEYESKRAMLEHRVAARAEYAKTDSGKEAFMRSRNKWSALNVGKKKAISAVNNAIKKGTLSKPSICETCKKEAKRIHGHHKDYSKQLDVMWLCPKCHNDWHRKNGPGINAE